MLGNIQVSLNSHLLWFGSVLCIKPKPTPQKKLD